jgi:hypothetical protein
MKCASCAKDNPPGARYCAHCGAEQSVPTPIAAVAAAMAPPPRSRVQQAANAARADPASDDRVPAAAVRDEPAPWPKSPSGADPAFHVPSPASAARDGPAPAYAAGPRRIGLAAGLLGTCIVAAVIAFTGWQWLRDDVRGGADTSAINEESVMSSYPPQATAPATRRSSATMAAAAPEPALPAKDSTSGGMAPASADTETATHAPAPATTRVPPVEIKPLPPKPAQRPARRVAGDKAPVQAQSQALQPTTTPEPAAPAAASAGCRCRGETVPRGRSLGAHVR